MAGVVEGDSEEVMERMGQLEDMRAEWHQRKTLEHYIHRAPPELFGVETVSEGVKREWGHNGRRYITNTLSMLLSAVPIVDSRFHLLFKGECIAFNQDSSRHLINGI